ncbi:MAG: hypothetical protein WCE23_15420 [Candidatus Binatus sp.]|uniref:hypothetical protein n=1 Tax=Candidatus Binatus sp. TaxID=2811406 RepID=UPI003C71B039
MAPRRDWDRDMKNLLKDIFADAYKGGGSDLVVHYGEGGSKAKLDGVICGQRGQISVEIDRKAAKATRGSLMDLINHDSPMKLLILDPAGPASAEGATKMCEYILKKFVSPPRQFQVCVIDVDWPKSNKVSTIEEAAKRLGWRRS